MATPANAADSVQSGRRIRRSALLLGVVAAAFYLGSMFILVWRAGR